MLVLVLVYKSMGKEETIRMMYKHMELCGPPGGRFSKREKFSKGILISICSRLKRA